MGKLDAESIDNIQIEDISLKIRDYWGLDKYPVNNLVDMLQSKGFVIAKLKIRTKKVDAFST